MKARCLQGSFLRLASNNRQTNTKLKGQQPDARLLPLVWILPRYCFHRLCWARTRGIVAVVEYAGAAVDERLSRAIKLGDADGERLVIAHSSIIEHADPHLLAQQNGSAGGTAEVNAGVNAVAKGNVMCQF